MTPTPKATELQALLERVEAASGPDREIDAAVWRAVYFERSTTLAVAQDDPADPDLVRVDAVGKPILKTVSGLWRWEPTTRPFREGVWAFDAEDGRHYRSYVHVTAITASLDAALALAERVLPEANHLGVEKDLAGWNAYVSRNAVESGHWLFEAWGKKTPALALVIAILKAMIATQGEKT